MTESIPPSTTLGAVNLTVSNLDRLLDWYQRVLGFKIHQREGDVARLGTGRDDLLVLMERPGVRKYRGTTGLYHYAVLLPSRRELALAIARLLAYRYPNSPTDHVMTETTYLDDPEGNGIEIYTDTPEDGTFGMVNGEFVTVDSNGVRRSGRDPLNVKELIQKNTTSDDRLDEPLPETAKIGHVHLHVRELNEARRFYHELLGFDDMGFAPAMGAGFVSAGGYHHHIGFNIWVGEGAPPPPPDATGLRYFTVMLPNSAELEKVVEHVQQAGIVTAQTEGGILVHDPSRNGVLLTQHSE